MSSPSQDPDFSIFAREACPDAFRRLTERHLPAVLAVAKRTLGVRRDLAEDVAQLVFLRLARKAKSLPEAIVVGAWLHRQTVRLSLNTLRSESRRVNREQTSINMESIETSPDESEPSWADAMPHIDRAILELSEKDRSALALRFGEQKKIREVGERLGVSPAAAEKRISRALEKLRNRLSRVGVVPSVALLGVWLSQDSATAAPTLLTHSIVQNTADILENSSSGFLSTLVTMTVTKSLIAGIAAGIIVGSSMLVWSSGAGNQKAERNRSESPVSSLDLGSRSKGILPLSSGAPNLAPTVKGMLDQVQQLLGEPDNEITRLRLRELLAEVPEENFAPFLELIETEVKKQYHLQRILPELARAWARLDPLAATEGLIKAKGVSNWDSSKLATEAFDVWHSMSPEAAQSWLIENQDNSVFQKAISQMIEVVSEDLAENSEMEAIAWASELEGDTYRKAALTGLWAQYTKDQYTADHSAELPRLFELLSGIEDKELARFGVRHLTSAWADRYKELEVWLETQEPSPLAYEAALSAAHLEQIKEIGGTEGTTLFLSLATEKRLANADRALSLAGDRKRADVITEIAQGMRVNPKEMLDWALSKIPAEEKDSTILRIAEDFAVAQKPAEHWMRSLTLNKYPPPRMALEWAMHHSDPTVRDPLIERFYRQWLSDSHSEGAKEFAQTSDVSDEIKAVLQRVEVGE